MATSSNRKKSTARRKTATAPKPASRRASPAVTARPARAARRPSPMDDYEAVRQVLSRYCMLIDTGKVTALSELFALDANFSVSFDDVPSHTGRANIRAWYAGFFGDRPKVGFPRHKLFEPWIVVTGNTATAASYFDSDFVEPGGTVRILAGRYDDTLVKVRGQWLFSSRTITISHHYSPAKCKQGMSFL